MNSINHGDLKNWLATNKVRENVLQTLLAAGSSYSGEWRGNPLFEYFQMDSGLSLTDFSVVYAKPEMMEQWGAGPDNEIVIIIMDGAQSAESAYVHWHDGGTMITGLGPSVGLPKSDARMLRGKFHLQHILDSDRRIILNSFKLEDMTYRCIQGLEPHGFVTLRDSITFALAVTCVKFNNGGDIDFTVADPARCKVRAQNQSLISLSEYANRSITHGAFV